RQVGVPYILVALNKCDMVDDEEILELVEMEVRELLASQDFDEEAPIVPISALKALEGEEKWVNAVVDLMKACDRSEEHTSELQSRFDLVCRLLLEKKNPSS